MFCQKLVQDGEFFFWRRESRQLGTAYAEWTLDFRKVTSATNRQGERRGTGTGTGTSCHGRMVPVLRLYSCVANRGRESWVLAECRVTPLSWCSDVGDAFGRRRHGASRDGKCWPQTRG
jgi:hypothetical protein